MAEAIAGLVHRSLFPSQGTGQPVGSAVATAWRMGSAAHHLVAGRTSRYSASPAGLLAAPGTPIQADTRFDLASLTKPMATTTLLALAAGQGRIDLGSTLAEWLEDARGTALGDVPLWLLGCHASGAPAWLDFAAATRAYAGDPAQRAAAVRATVLAQPLARPPATTAVYSDLGYMALGWVLERVWDAPLDATFSRLVAQPLGLQAGYRRSSRHHAAEAIVATEIWPPRCADGLALCGSVHDDNCAALGGVAGHAGLFASAADVLAWATCWLHALQGKTQPLDLQPQLVQRWLATCGAAGSSWRLGWDTPSQPGSTAGQRAPRDAVGHLGFTGTSVWLSAAADTAIVLLTNRVHPSRDATAAIRALRPALHDAIWPDDHGPATASRES